MSSFANQPISQELSPLVSVAMPVYNAGKFLRAAVLSIVRQTYKNWELLIMDDGSTDGALDSIADIEDARIRTFRDGRNRGIAVRLNEAVDLARGRYFARMDSDDVSYPQRFEYQVAFLNSDAAIDLLATRAIAIGEDDRVLSLFPTALTHDEICHQPWRGFFFPHPTWMGKVEWFRKHRYRVPAPYCSEDQELLLRSYRESRFATLPEVLFAYRIRSKTSFEKLFRTRRAMVGFQAKQFFQSHLWLYGALSIAGFMAKVCVDFSRSYLLQNSLPQWSTASKATIAEWGAINADIATQSKLL